MAVISVFPFGKRRIRWFWYRVVRKMPGLLTGCRPVSFREHLINAGFTIEEHLEISQNTFPSAVFIARKLNK
ncbi:MAG: hypothetical protein GXO83_04810 [Chlorobi bacterium]|nr:hypothetical protein [Chlorobiota bacterium]